MDFQLVEFSAEGFDRLGRDRNVSLARDDSQLAGQSAIKIPDPGFFGRDAEN